MSNLLALVPDGHQAVAVALLSLIALLIPSPLKPMARGFGTVLAAAGRLLLALQQDAAVQAIEKVEGLTDAQRAEITQIIQAAVAAIPPPPPPVVVSSSTPITVAPPPPAAVAASVQPSQPPLPPRIVPPPSAPSTTGA